MSKTNARGARETAFTAETTESEHCLRVCNICTFPEDLREKHNHTNTILILKRLEGHKD